MTINNINQGIHVALVRIANIVANSIKDKVSKGGQGGYPQGDDEYGWIPIQDTVKIGQVQQGQGVLSITITLGGNDAPYATAYEWGSGIHATRGLADVYPLAARPGTKNLVFWWEKRGKMFIGPALPIGHPGVAPKPYIQPSINENMQNMLKIMGEEFVTSIFIGEDKVEEINVRY